MLKPAADEHQLQAQLLNDGLRGLFGEFNETVLAALLPLVEWLEVPGGAVVVHEGAHDDDLYCVISGRLRAYTGGGESARRFLSEMRRGETIGEVAFFTGAVRSATVSAVRDSVLVRLTRTNLETLLAAFPQVLMNMARLIASRLSRANHARRIDGHPVNICLLPITPLSAEHSAPMLALKLIAALAGSVPEGKPSTVLNAGKLAALLNVPDVANVANISEAHPDDYRRLTRALDEIEAQHEVVVYVPDDDLETEWSRRCLRMADRVLLLADATQPPAISAVEARYLSGAQRLTEAEQVLVLLHPAGCVNPHGTRHWLERRPLSAHIHLRPELQADVARLTRTLCGRSVGLVFGDGGARCFAQLGVYKALQEARIPIDYVGGTSFGAVMAAMAAVDRPADELIAHARQAFRVSPTGDISFFPMMSLIKGKNMNDLLGLLFDGLSGPGADIEDTWKNFFCMVGNYSHAAETTLARGPLVKSLRASCAIPGLLPPVPMNGDLMVDGATFNSFPTDVMYRQGARRLIGVELARDLSPKYAFDEVPSNWKLLNDKLTGRRKEFHLPSLMQVMMNSATLYSASRTDTADALLDLGFKINLRSVGLLDWHKFDYAVETGYQRAKAMIAELSQEALAEFQR